MSKIMTKQDYLQFVNKVQNIIVDYVSNYAICANCQFPQNENEDIKWTILFGEMWGNVNILIESFNNIQQDEKETNIYSINIKFVTYRDNERFFNYEFGNVEYDGTMIMVAEEKDKERLINVFREIFEILCMDKDKRIANPIEFYPN